MVLLDTQSTNLPSLWMQGALVSFLEAKNDDLAYLRSPSHLRMLLLLLRAFASPAPHTALDDVLSPACFGIACFLGRLL